MIRFFVYSDLEPANDNNDPLVLDDTQLDWRRYESDPNINKSKYVAEALNNAFNLSVNGFDHVIGNCNSAPAWLKTNGAFNNPGAGTNNTLITGGESEYSEFLVTFLNGMKSRYNIDVTAISPTNEPDWFVTYESMNTTAEETASIVINLKDRLNNSGLSNIKVLSPECFRISSDNIDVSATNHINRMFAVPGATNAVDVVATHTYGNKNHDANWNALKTAASGKPVWVTESAALHSTDQSMTDAAHYIKWILNGFNNGGLTAYMSHIFYEEEDAVNGYSSLVAWTSTGQIVLPKRYHTYKHFANLIKPGFKLIDSQIIQSDIVAGAFKSADSKKVVLQVFNENATQNISINIPTGTTSITHYVTSDSTGQDFSIMNDIAFNIGDRYASINVPSMSLHSIVFNIDTTLLF